MRSILFMVSSVIFAIIIIPMLLIQSCEITKPEIEKQQAVVESNTMVSVYVTETRKVVTIDLEEYLVGVVAGEMPAAFQEEALKAQAIAARSYAMARINRYKEGGHPDHPGAALCNDVHCQVWHSKDKLREIKPKNWMRDYWPKLEKVVEETKGLVMTYQGKLVDQPLFHSTSGGRTENSEDVFASAVPYLRSVESPHEQRAPYLTDVQIVSLSSFVSKVRNKYKDCSLTEQNAATAIKIIERSEGGRILRMQLDNKVVTGREIRDLLGLRSANFKIALNGKNLEFTTVGYGHGVGMSQWGANGMAENGATYEQILKHYYQGVEIQKLK